VSASDYADLLLGRRIFDASFDEVMSADWIPVEHVQEIFRSEMRAAFKVYGYDVGSLFDENAVEYVSWMQDQRALAVEGDDFTGFYCKLNVAKKSQIIGDFLANQEQSKRIAKLGESALGRALSALAQQGGWQSSSDSTDFDDFSIDSHLAPASSRIVRFNDNQIYELDEKATHVIDAVSAQNYIGATQGLRELILGQLKAGRELIRSGSVRLYLLELALIDTLKVLARRYEKETIGALASTLLAALAQHIGINS
jgi:hypothetical protein